MTVPLECTLTAMGEKNLSFRLFEAKAFMLCVTMCGMNLYAGGGVNHFDHACKTAFD